ncbi:hypothetical protein KUW04_06415 [Halomonas denitrificans]|nr:hypothetical protein [Halomonas denitrificans]
MKSLPLSRYRQTATWVFTATLLSACGGSDESLPQMTINNDRFTEIPGRQGGVTGSVLANDTLDNAGLGGAEFTLSLISADAPLTLSPDGRVQVAAMTSAGEYQLQYRVCLAEYASLCATGNVAVEVSASTLTLSDESISDLRGNDAQTLAMVLANDRLDGEVLDPADVTVKVVESDEPLSLLDLEVRMAGNTPAGDYQLHYQVCENLNPSNCQDAAVNVQVVPAALTMTDESLSGINGGYAQRLVDLLANDLLDGVAMDPAEVTLTALEADAVLTIEEQALQLEGGTLAGEYQLNYRVCEQLNPQNCADAVAMVSVEKGQFMQGLAGLKYVSDSASGYTDEQGGYDYQAGDRIQFFVGNSAIGEAVAAHANLSVFDLFPGAEFPTTARAMRRFQNSYYMDGRLTELSQAVNAALLLYSLDSDKQAENGISLNTQLHDLLIDNAFDLNKKIGSFDNHGLKLTMHKAYNNALIANADTPDPHVVMAYLNTRYGAEDTVFSVVEERYSEGDYREIYRYNFDADNHQFNSEHYELDAQGEALPDTRYEQFEYYDAYLNYFGYESFYQGTPERQSIVERDIHGRMTVSSNFQNDILTSRYTYTYHDNGLVSGQTNDRNGDGTIDYQYWYRFDEAGNEIEQIQDINGDGNYDYIYRSEYEDGRLVKYQEYWDVSYNAEGMDTLDAETLFYFDDQGRRTQVVNNNFARGNVTVTDYHYDEAGHLSMVTIDRNPDDESIDLIYYYTYNAKGQLEEFRYDNGGDGVSESGSVYRYDDHGNQIYRAQFANGDFDNPTYQIFSEYDELGNQLRNDTDNNGDGVIDYSYLATTDESGYVSVDEGIRYTNGEPTSSWKYEYTRKASNLVEYWYYGY